MTIGEEMQLLDERFAKSRKKARALRREVEKLRAELDRSRKVIVLHENKANDSSKAYDRLLFDNQARQVNEHEIVLFLNSIGPYNSNQSLFANVAAALARAALGREG